MSSDRACEYTIHCFRPAACGVGIIDPATDGYRLLVLACEDCVWDLHAHTDRQYRRMPVVDLLRLRNARERREVGHLSAARGA